MSKRISLTQYLIEERRHHPDASGDLNSLILGIALATLANHALASVFGAGIAAWIAPRTLRWLTKFKRAWLKPAGDFWECMRPPRGTCRRVSQLTRRSRY